MSIAITATGQDVGAQIDPRLGRCPWFVILDTDTGSVLETCRNPGAEQGGGAGIQAAQKLVDLGVEAVITGHCGPNAHRVLDAAGIKVLQTQASKVHTAWQELKDSALATLEAPDVSSHHGH